MQKFFAFIGMVVVVCFAVGMGNAVVRHWWPGPSATTSEADAAPSDVQDVSPREEIIRSIIWVRATLPRAIDDQTKLVALGLDGKIFWSHLVVDVDAHDLSNDARGAIRRDAKTYGCQRLGAAMQTGTISSYRADYVDRRRIPIQTIEITKNDCL